MKPKLEVEMKKEIFLTLMEFPYEWLTFELYPDELFLGQLSEYEKYHDDDGSEHYRNGAFHWWLKKEPSKDILVNLTSLTFSDPDQLMAEDVRSYIIKINSYDEDVENMMKEMYITRLYSISRDS